MFKEFLLSISDLSLLMIIAIMAVLSLTRFQAIVWITCVAFWIYIIYQAVQ